MAANLPGQSAAWCGQAIQVARCGSHSAGMRYAILVVAGMEGSIRMTNEVPLDRHSFAGRTPLSYDVRECCLRGRVDGGRVPAVVLAAQPARADGVGGLL